MKNLTCISSGRVEYVSSFHMSGNTFVWASSPNQDEAIDFDKQQAEAVSLLLSSYGFEVEVVKAW